jgi:hypothetical protein
VLGDAIPSRRRVGARSGSAIILSDILPIILYRTPGMAYPFCMTARGLRRDDENARKSESVALL